MPSATPAPDIFLPDDDLLRAVLDVSLVGLNVLRPVYDSTGELEDFALEYLNPASQRMTGLPERPGGMLLARFPHTLASGVFDFYRRVYETGDVTTYETNYQADGLDNCFRARRSGEWLVVSFTDTADEPRNAVEEALREAQTAEKMARAEAQRQRFYEVLMQLPAQVATYHGPEHVYAFVNPRYQSYFPGRDLQGRPISEALPEVAEQGILAALDRVYHRRPAHGPARVPARRRAPGRARAPTAGHDAGRRRAVSAHHCPARRHHPASALARPTGRSRELGRRD